MPFDEDLYLEIDDQLDTICEALGATRDNDDIMNEKMKKLHDEVRDLKRQKNELIERLLPQSEESSDGLSVDPDENEELLSQGDRLSESEREDNSERTIDYPDESHEQGGNGSNESSSSETDTSE